jgi:hypothetical protein
MGNGMFSVPFNFGPFTMPFAAAQIGQFGLGGSVIPTFEDTVQIEDSVLTPAGQVVVGGSTQTTAQNLLFAKRSQNMSEVVNNRQHNLDDMTATAHKPYPSTIVFLNPVFIQSANMHFLFDESKNGSDRPIKADPTKSSIALPAGRDLNAIATNATKAQEDEVPVLSSRENKDIYEIVRQHQLSPFNATKKGDLTEFHHDTNATFKSAGSATIFPKVPSNFTELHKNSSQVPFTFTTFLKNFTKEVNKTSFIQSVAPVVSEEQANLVGSGDEEQPVTKEKLDLAARLFAFQPRDLFLNKTDTRDKPAVFTGREIFY